jgi:splicing factor 3B subunit 3
MMCYDVLCCAVLCRLQGHEELRAVLPRREDLSGDRGVLIVAYASHKKKAYSFFLLQVWVRPIGKMCVQGSA